MKLYDIGRSGIFTRGRLPRPPARQAEDGGYLILEQLLDTGITLAVSLTPEGEPLCEMKSQRVLEFEYLHVPLRDVNERPMLAHEISEASRAAVLVARHITAGRGNALVMCRAGRNRTGLVTALALTHIYPHWSGAYALEQLRQHRPGACMIKADGSSPVPHTFERYLQAVDSLVLP